MLYFCSSLFLCITCKFWLVSYFALVNFPAGMVFFPLVIYQGGLIPFFPLVISQVGLIFFPLQVYQGGLTFFLLVISQEKGT